MVEASINTPFQLLRICWELKYVPLQNESFPGTHCSTDTLTDAAGPFCCETQQPQFSQEGKSPAEDYRGVRKANRQAHTMRTLFPHLGPAPHLKETLLWEFSERAAQGSEGESKFSLSPALPAVPGCGSRARTSSSADLAGASPSWEDQDPPGDWWSRRDTPPGDSWPLVVSPALVLFQIKISTNLSGPDCQAI